MVSLQDAAHGTNKSCLICSVYSVRSTDLAHCRRKPRFLWACRAVHRNGDAPGYGCRGYADVSVGMRWIHGSGYVLQRPRPFRKIKLWFSVLLVVFQCQFLWSCHRPHCHHWEYRWWKGRYRVDDARKKMVRTSLTPSGSGEASLRDNRVNPFFFFE